METLLQDLRYGFRMFRKNPGFAIVAILTLGLGIGGNTAMFSVVDAVLIRPLPYPAPDRLVMLSLDERAKHRGTNPHSYGLADFLAVREQQRSFERVAAFAGGGNGVTLTGFSQPEQVPATWVSAAYFATLGATPLIGAVPTGDDDKPGKEPVVVASHRFWRTHLDSSSNAIGRMLALNGKAYRLVGVMPEDFRPLGAPDSELYPVYQFEPPRNRPPYYLRVFGRLKPGVAVQQAEAEVTNIAALVGRQYPDSPYQSASTIPLRTAIVGDSRPVLLLLLAGVGFVLLIAIANVASLLLARASVRQTEMSVRCALGASRSRIIRQSLTESFLIASIGGVTGVLLARAGIQLLIALAPRGMPLEGITLDVRVLLFTFLVSVASGILFGLAPAWQSWRTSLHETLKERGAGAGAGANRLVHDGLVILEFALALVLLTGAGLMIRSFVKLRGVSPGFSPDRVLTMRISLPPSTYSNEPQIIAFYQQLLARTRTVPGVRSAGITMSLPPNLLQITNPFTVEGQPRDGSRPLQLAEEMTVSPDYFRALGAPLLRGRFFTDADKAGAPMVLIINESMARNYFPNQDPIGKRIQTGDPNPKNPWETIVGVVGDVKYDGLDAREAPTLYVPYTSEGWASWSRSMFLVVATSMDPLHVAGSIRREVSALDKNLPVTHVRTMTEVLDASVTQPRFRTYLFGTFSFMALFLAAIGIYAVLAYSVSQRTREMGIRLALGAQPGAIVRLVVGHGMLLVAVGVLIGLAAAFAVTRLMAALLFGVSPTDPASFVSVASLLAVVALAACYLPARLAARVDPLVALHYE